MRKIRDDGENLKGKYYKFNKFFLIFNKFSFLGLVCILSSIIFGLILVESIFRSILTTLLYSIGTALIIGAIFDFSKNSHAFMDLISNILSDIVISKNFLSRLEKADKREALALILQPLDSQIEQYSNINEYFQKKLNDNICMFDTNFKTNFVLNTDVKKDINRGKVVIEGTLTYRIYKIQNKYEPIITKFDKDNSSISNTRLIFSDGTLEVNKKSIKEYNEIEADINYKTYSFVIPDELYKYPYLTLQRDIFEEGFDHWINFNYTALTPYDGIVFNLNCCDGLTIKEHIIFDKKAPYHVKKSPDNKSLQMVSTEWLDAYTGFTVIISEDQNKAVPDTETDS